MPCLGWFVKSFSPMEYALIDGYHAIYVLVIGLLDQLITVDGQEIAHDSL